MALANTIDPHWAAQQLSNWLARKLPGAREIVVNEVSVPTGSGMSNETVLFRAAWHDDDGRDQECGLVARVAPTGEGLFPSYDIEREFHVMRALAERTGVPVPAARWHESDPRILGGPFLVMDRVDGRIPADDPPFAAEGWVLELTSEQRSRMVNNGIGVLAELHTVDWRALGLDDLPRGLDPQLSYWRRFYDWARVDVANPTIDAAFDWLDVNRPPGDQEPLVMNWGDARIGNMVFAEDLSIAGVLDWEAAMVCIASPELDLGWWLFSSRFAIEAVGLEAPQGFPTRTETVARYEQLTGHRPVHLEFYETFAAVRASALMVRAAHLMSEAGFLPPDNTMALNNPATKTLAAMLGQPDLHGDAVTFAGNRGLKSSLASVASRDDGGSR